jgi:hypothetical protein
MAKPKPKAGAVVVDRRFKGMVHGPQGQGKTHFMGTLAHDPRTAPALFLNFEAGDLTLQGMPGEWDMADVRSWDDYNTQYERLLTNKEGFKSVGVDSLSETHLFALLNVIEQEGAKRKNKDLIEQGDYGTAMVQMRRLVRHFRDLDMHVLFLASSKDVKDPREGMVKKPALAGQLADDIPGMMDMVGYMAITDETDEDGDPTGNVIRSLLLQNYPKIRIKVRTPWGVVAPDEIDNPTMTNVLDTLGYGG